MSGPLGEVGPGVAYAVIHVPRVRDVPGPVDMETARKRWTARLEKAVLAEAVGLAQEMAKHVRYEDLEAFEFVLALGRQPAGTAVRQSGEAPPS